jgi:D-alanine-D-alanine ligase
VSPRREVAVVFGGRSPEHSISCLTAAGVTDVIDPDQYDVVPVGVTLDGRWVTDTSVDAMTALGADGLPSVHPQPSADVTPPGRPPSRLASADVVFPLLHGAYGEDGTLQGLLEVLDVRYVGSGVLASAAAMDKDVMKTLLAAAGLPVCRWVRTSTHDWADDPEGVTARVGSLGWPVFVKPARAGSSFGITKVRDAGQLGAALAHAFDFDPKVIVEEAVVGREVECGVVCDAGAAHPEVSVVGEVVIGGDHDYYDFEVKYTDADALRLEIPAELDVDVTDRIRAAAAAAFDTLGCEGLARVDFFLTDGGNIVLNEVNTMPGFTPSSMFPRAWAATGVPYPRLVDRLLRSALDRPLGLR